MSRPDYILTFTDIVSFFEVSDFYYASWVGTHIKSNAAFASDVNGCNLLHLAIQIPNSRSIIELHSRIPFFHYLPKVVQDYPRPNRDFYDFRPATVLEYLKDSGLASIRKYQYPPEVTGLPLLIKLPVPMGYLLLFISAET
ncbi:MAG: hypothetical protein ABSG74_09620 [Candidatus Bathyarchaeia archaeon]|jgi:hypothetical protein